MKCLRLGDRDVFRLVSGNVRVRGMENFSQLSSVGVWGVDRIVRVWARIWSCV